MVQMSLRLFERIPRELPSRSIINVEKNFLFSENNLLIQAKLDSGVYCETDTIMLSLAIRRAGGHGVKKVKVTTMQQVKCNLSSNDFVDGLFAGRCGHVLDG